MLCLGAREKKGVVLIKLLNRFKRRRNLFAGSDLSGIPTHACVCGCNVFETLVAFEDNKVAWYTLTGYCYNCNNKVTLPTEMDGDDDGDL